MAAASEQSVVQGKRPWVVHTVWALVALACLAGGVALGFRWSASAWAGLTSTNSQNASFARIRVALTAVESNEPNALRHGNAVLLYEAVSSLGYLPRYVNCRDSDRDHLARGITWLDAHPSDYGDTFSDARKLAAAFCDKPAETVRIP